LPGEEIEIPAIVYNLSQKATEVQLKISGLKPGMDNSRNSTNIANRCGRLPTNKLLVSAEENTRTLSRKYDFAIEAKSNTSNRNPREKGV
jgi:hypothetical protein